MKKVVKYICLIIVAIVLIQALLINALNYAIRNEKNSAVETMVKIPIIYHNNLDRCDTGWLVGWIPECGGTTPLETACKASNYEAAKILIDNGASIEKKRILGKESLLNQVVFNYDDGDLDIVKLLIEKGADPFGNEYDDECPLVCLSGTDAYGEEREKKVVEIYKYLYSQMGEGEYPLGENGETTLIKAAEAGNFELVKYIVENKIDRIEEKDKDGKTAYDYAKDCDYLKIGGITNES